MENKPTGWKTNCINEYMPYTEFYMNVTTTVIERHVPENIQVIKTEDKRSQFQLQ